MKNLEILAPAGNLENLKVAISNGANAVYLGLQNFNARNKADNFTTENIGEIVKYCHLRDVKVYLTVNTLVKNEELNDLIDMIKICVDAKVDAYIVQDFGVAYLLKNAFKNIVLHASTQMGVHNLKGAKLLEEYGFSRVVLSRETKLEDIKQISQNTNLEIEYFVQGALCVAFSGNCYLSSLCHSESGNRGRCLQLCRLKYRSYQNEKFVKDGYLLSPTDLCFIDRLKSLKDAGVSSLKIEGRMRRAGYVAGVVKEYKKAIEGLGYDKSTFDKTFYRGEYNSGKYLDEKSPNVINPDFQNHRGVEVGYVKAVKPFKNLNEVIIYSTHNIVQNDGLKFVNKSKELSMGVGSVKTLAENLYSVITTARPTEKDKVYLTVDKVWEDKITTIYDKLTIKAIFVAKQGKTPTLTFEYKDIIVNVVGDNIAEKAKTQPTTKDSIKDSISKLGDTDFVLDAFDADIDEIFIPKSQLNDLRRKCADLLKDNILQEYNLNNIRDITYIAQDKPKLKIEDFCATIIDENYNGDMLDNVIISPTDYRQVSKIKAVMSKAKGKKYLNLPVVANLKDMEVLDNLIKEIDFDGVVANNIYGLAFDAKEIIAGTGLNIINDYAVAFINAYGVNKYIRSIEKYLAKGQNGGSGYSGKAAFMTMCHCTYKVNYGNDCSKCSYKPGLVYRQEGGKEFEIRRYVVDSCYFELLGKVEDTGAKIIDIR